MAVKPCVMLTVHRASARARKRALKGCVAACREDRAGSLGLCPLLNASVCHATVEMSNLGHGMVAALYNPLAWPRAEGVRIPINTSCSSSWTVRGQPKPRPTSPLLLYNIACPQKDCAPFPSPALQHDLL